MKKYLFIILILFFTSTVFSQQKTKEIPKNVKVIGLNCSDKGYIQTVIDLKNNEIVCIHYAIHYTNGLNITFVTRTGMFVNPNDYKSITMSDAPYKDEDY